MSQAVNRQRSKTDSLASLYGPIHGELEQVEAILRRELCSEFPKVDRLVKHGFRLGGKRLRPALVLLSAKVTGGVRPEHAVLAATMELIHTATLIHDDVLDEADLRRQAPTVSRRWGNESAVLLGDYLFSHAFRLCSMLEDPYAARLIGSTAVRLTVGELLQVNRSNEFSLGEAEYFDIIRGKTASLIGACGLLGARYAGAAPPVVERMNEFGLLIGTAFQIVDDVLDLIGNEREVGKTLGRDLDKGKLTLPLIHCLHQSGQERRASLLALLNNGFSSHKRDNGKLERSRRIVELLREADSFDYARTAAETNVRRALEILQDLPPSPARESLAALAEFIVERRT